MAFSTLTLRYVYPANRKYVAFDFQKYKSLFRENFNSPAQPEKEIFRIFTEKFKAGDIRGHYYESE